LFFIQHQIVNTAANLVISGESVKEW